MLFNSYIFIFIFLPITLMGYYLFNHIKAYRFAMVWLTGMSLWFYGYFNISYLFIIAISIIVNYVITTIMQKYRYQILLKKCLFVLGLLFNIGLLFYYKYYDFFISNINQIFKSNLPLLHIMLPLGISFFTFQQLSYVIDCYKSEMKDYEFIYYASYVTFFPQLIAGPIVLHDELIPQFTDLNNRKLNYDNMLRGLYAFSLGLGKKVLLADVFSKIVNYGFSEYASMNATNILLVMICYSLQIYFDFSGYCDMAIGIGYMFNVKLPINFNSPYKADSIADFWDRWHMTLTRFFTQYIYIPLGGNRKGKLRTYINIMIVFLISGFWHGANWTFVLWGVLNGLAIVIHKMFGKYVLWVPKAIKVVVTFFITTIAWCLFRSDTITDAGQMIKRLFTVGFGDIEPKICEIVNNLTESRFLFRFGMQGIINCSPPIVLLLLLASTLFAVWFTKNTQEKVKIFVPTILKLMVFLALMILGVVSLSEISEFLYFNF